jgi:hypothetical protein
VVQAAIGIKRVGNAILACVAIAAWLPVIAAPEAPSPSPATSSKALAWIEKKDAVPPKGTHLFVETRGADPDVLFASAIDGDHESVGINLKAGSNYFGISGWHSIYLAKDIDLALPTGGLTGIQYLYAPTARPPNGACLEVGTAYKREAGKPTQVFLYAFDFCSDEHQFVRWLPFGDEEAKTLTRTSDVGGLMYLFEIHSNTPVLGGGTVWTANLFDFKANVWKHLAQSTGISSDLRGWSIFETYYQAGQCSKSLPLLFSRNIQLFDGARLSWVAAQPTPGPLYRIYDSTSQAAHCFHNDATGAASYLFSLDSKQGSWQVSSTGH